MTADDMSSELWICVRDVFGIVALLLCWQVALRIWSGHQDSIGQYSVFPPSCRQMDKTKAVHDERSDHNLDLIDHLESPTTTSYFQARYEHTTYHLKNVVDNMKK